MTLRCAMKKSPINRRLPSVYDKKNAYALACEVRNPLNTIKGGLIYLQENPVDKQVLAEFIQIMRTEISHIEDVVSDFPCPPLPAIDQDTGIPINPSHHNQEKIA